MLLRVGYTTKMSSETTTQQHYIKLTSNSEKFMREVSIVGWSPMPQIGLFKRTDTRPVEMLPYAENKLYGFRNDRYFRIYVGDVAPGEIVQLGFDAPRESAPIFVVYYDDYRGTSWEYDTSVSRRRKARWLYRKR
ncbi:hypothetical protein EDF22_1347 [Rathayibacter sp. PhB127]|nr:hypothetical protein EDF22_1347 [Rathayibacter sp. PhB127]